MDLSVAMYNGAIPSLVQRTYKITSLSFVVCVAIVVERKVASISSCQPFPYRNVLIYKLEVLRNVFYFIPREQLV